VLPLVAARADRQVELRAVTGEVARQLNGRLGEQDIGLCVDPRPERGLIGPMSVITEVVAGECAAVRDDRELAQLAFNDAVSSVHTQKTAAVGRL
jgi:hypothetical protein